MACPWANIKKPEAVNLTEIMSEEVARDLQAKENEKLGQRSPTTGKFIHVIHNSCVKSTLAPNYSNFYNGQ